MGSIVLAGCYEPGTVVALHAVADEAVLRIAGGEPVEKRIADSAGSVGFDGLPDGARYIALGYVNGVCVETRVRSLAEGETQGELHQPPPTPPVNLVGSQEAQPAPEVIGTPEAELGTGIPSKPDTESAAAPTTDSAPTPSSDAHVIPSTEPAEGVNAEVGGVVLETTTTTTVTPTAEAPVSADTPAPQESPAAAAPESSAAEAAPAAEETPNP